MGDIWKVTMPLLSTLAALVIIVHSAEEIYERDNRQIRSRALDVAPSNYEQSWRAMEVEPETTMSSQIKEEEVWGDDSSIEPMRRRRRKRKRRPNQSQDEISPQEGFLYGEASQTHQQDTVEMPRRRRKKVEYQDSRERNGPRHWNEEGLERPLRRRGQRRKRPPVLSEFNSFEQYEKPDSREEIMHEQDTRIDSSDNQNDAREVNEHIESEILVDQSDPQFIEVTTQEINNNNKLLYEKNIEKDRSLSEFSSELLQPAKNFNTSLITSNFREKPKINDNNVESPKGKRPIDPVTLKTILKKSNGKSLSEILQQNNLSLADLLHGEEKAISILQRKDLMNDENSSEIKSQTSFVENNIKTADIIEKNNSEDISLDKQKWPENKTYRDREDVETTTDCSTNNEIVTLKNTESSKNTESIKTDQSNNLPLVESTTRNYLRRRFPAGVRRKLHMRPSVNNTYKGQLSRDLITSTSLKYKNSKTLSKSKEWRDVLSEMTRRSQNLKQQNVESGSDIVVKIITTTLIPEETTTEKLFETTTDISDAFVNTETTSYTDSGKTESLSSTAIDGSNFKTERLLPTTTITYEDSKEDKEIIVEKPKVVPKVKIVNASELRKQAYNNRLKRNRLRQKISTTELPEEQGLKDIYGNSNFVSASEFIAKTEARITKSEPVDDYSTLEDFITTEASRSTKIDINRSTRIPQRTNRFTGSITTVSPFTTGETAKYEIDEILSDNLASARLSKILKERNMTLNELVEHRERGSSHVHLADIFHNASKEPNPPEPFLSKSLIEPISKETYPLRALLEANSYDSKTTTVEPNLNGTNNLNVPVVMDFGNNVNENGENKGIISLFNNFSRIDSERQNFNDKDKEIVEEKFNENISKNEAGREGRLLGLEKELMSWNDLIALMQKNHQQQNTENEIELTEDSTITNALKRNHMEKDIDQGGLIALEDLQKLKELDSRITSDELLEFKLYENVEPTKIPSVLGSATNNNATSVTVATASIIGLVMILFLLTYAILKWKEQNKMFQKKYAKEDECVPTPIFENRKSHNSSIRSKSPMIASSNIYAIDSIDARGGNESPEYMWDTLRKPFQ
ncbi:unnamed protein product [Euphydryas editha]|uniref:Uncharacterized protein n=1 Tax=Euphydryas editha TaxID=104508 RepID=A0AAU9TXX8_EUPED|nr:unnamed protein product [Euphydryas editha]